MEDFVHHDRPFTNGIEHSTEAKELSTMMPASANTLIRSMADKEIRSTSSIPSLKRHVFLLLLVIVVLILPTSTVTGHESCCKHKLLFDDDGDDSDDPHHGHADDYDDDDEEPEFIDDPNDENTFNPPIEFEGQQRFIVDPNDSKPSAWDDEDDGPWEPNMILNPNYQWKPKQIINPNYDKSKNKRRDQSKKDNTKTRPSFIDKFKVELKAAIPWVTLGVVVTAVLQVLEGKVSGIQRVIHLLSSYSSSNKLSTGSSFQMMISLFAAAILGLITPLCSCGALPLALSMANHHTIPVSSVLTFLIASQSAGLDSAAITYGILGPTAAMGRLIGAIILAFVVGVVVASSATTTNGKSPSSTTNDPNDDGFSTGFTVKEGPTATSTASATDTTSSCCNDETTSHSTGSNGECKENKGQHHAKKKNPPNTWSELQTSLCETAAEIVPTIFIGLALSTLALHYLPSLSTYLKYYKKNSNNQSAATSSTTSFMTTLLLRLGLLMAAVPLQLCEHTSVTLAAGISKSMSNTNDAATSSATGLAFAFLLSAPALNMPTIWLISSLVSPMASSSSSSSLNKYWMPIKVVCALVVTSLIISYVIDYMQMDDLFVPMNSSNDNTDNNTSTMMTDLPSWWHIVSPCILGYFFIHGRMDKVIRERQIKQALEKSGIAATTTSSSTTTTSSPVVVSNTMTNGTGTSPKDKSE